MRVGNIQNNISFQRTQAFIVNPKEEKEFRERLEEKFPQEEWNYSIEDFTKFFYDKVDAFIFASEKPGYGEYGYTLMKAAGMERKVLVVLTGVDNKKRQKKSFGWSSKDAPLNHLSGDILEINGKHTLRNALGVINNDLVGIS